MMPYGCGPRPKAGSCSKEPRHREARLRRSRAPRRTCRAAPRAWRRALRAPRESHRPGRYRRRNIRGRDSPGSDVVQQSFTGENFQGFADRCSRNVELLRQIDFIDPLARLEFAGEDGGAQGIGYGYTSREDFIRGRRHGSAGRGAIGRLLVGSGSRLMAYPCIKWKG